MSHDNNNPVADAIKELEGPADALDALRAAVVADAMAIAITRVADDVRARHRLAVPNTQRMLDEAQRQETSLHEAPKPTRTRKRKPTLAGVARQAARAGIPVAGYEVQDGSIKVITGKPVGASEIDNDDTTSPEDRSEWK